MATKQTIAEKIRKHYNSEDGEWIIQAGKMKEAKLLKEACETIENQADRIRVLQNNANNTWTATAKSQSKLTKPYEEKISTLATELKLERKRISELKEAFKSVNNIFEATYFNSGFW